MKPVAGDRKWSVKVRDLQEDVTVIESFDAVMVCNGHYFKPSIPNIPGRDIFTGKQMHSHDYRVPEVFDGKRVVVLGAGPSGTYDVTGEITYLFFLIFSSRYSQNDSWNFDLLTFSFHGFSSFSSSSIRR